MNGAKEYLQVKFLKTLEPLASLSVDKLEEIANKSQVEELPPGRIVFRQGEKDSRSVYLLVGQLELQVTGNPRTEIIKAKSNEARYPVAQEWPRPSTCRTKTNAVLLYIDSNLLEILLSDDPSGRYEVAEIGVEEDDENDWMLRFLQSPAFLRLPTDNIQKLLMKLEEVPVRSGQTIVQQGDSDDWYYIVKQGKCVVSRRPAPKAEDVRLAVLGPGDGFGEEALITHGKRNANVTAREDGILMRLQKADFHSLLVEPMLEYIDHPSMMEKVKAGAALIDVRSNKEFTDNGIRGALSIPLSMLRLKTKDLNPTREHIVYCNDGNLSNAAAFLLGQQSLQVYVLRNGLNGQQKTFSPASASKPKPAEATPSSTTAASQLSESIPPLLKTSVTQATEIPTVTEEVFKEHKRQAQTQAQRAFEAESVRKQAEAKTSKLRQEADALRAQANRLATKTASAEAQRQKAEDEIQRIRADALKQRDEMLASAKIELEREQQRAKQSEAEISNLKLQAEEARRRAEEELNRIKRESEAVIQKQTQLDNEFKRAESEKQQAARAAEVARIVAKQEAEKVKSEAEAIRQEAIQEAERLKQEMHNRKAKLAAEEAARHEAAVEGARRKAETAIQEAAKAAEEARHQAQMEAELIRKQALQEAEHMRRELEMEKQRAAEAAARAKAEEQLRLQELDSVRQQTMDEARRQAEHEAEKIRQQAFEEARHRAREESRKLVELEAASLRQKTFEEVQRQALHTARLQAEQVAEAIRREALEEANRLRQEMESTRQLIENETIRAKARINEENARRQEEEDALARAAEESARRATEEAERRRAEDTRRRLEEEARRAEEARRLQEEAEQLLLQEERARQLAEEQQRLAAEQEEHTRQLAEEQQRLAAEQAERARAQAAEQHAKELQQRLAQSNARKQSDEFSYAEGSGPKLSKAKLHITRDKTILEGEEDIFVFKAPSERPPTKEQAEKLLKEAEAQFREKKDLPSFEIQYAEEPPPKAAADAPEFSDSIIQDLGDLTASTGPQTQKSKAKKPKEDFEFSLPEDIGPGPQQKSRSKRSLFALAASVVLMVGISIVVITTHPSFINKNALVNLSDADATSNSDRSLASISDKVGNKARAAAETRVKAEADAEFNKLLSQWRQQNKNHSATGN